MEFKSGVYFVHYDDIPLFVETAKAQERYFCGDYQLITSDKYKDTYRPFSIDKHTDRMSYWNTNALEAMKDWDDWDYTDEYIEHWRPNELPTPSLSLVS